MFPSISSPINITTPNKSIQIENVFTFAMCSTIVDALVDGVAVVSVRVRYICLHLTANTKVLN